MPFLSPPIPFRINFDSNEIDDLNKRLKNARWPKQDIIPYEAQNEQLFNSFGPNLNQMKEWTQGWLNYNWREREEHFNTSVESLYD